MNPKVAPPKTDKISLARWKFGLTASVLWDREILCDYIANRMHNHGEALARATEDMNGASREIMFEVLAICDALTRIRGRGMNAEVAVNLDGIASFVNWSKDELFSCVVSHLCRFERELRVAAEGVSEPADIAEVLYVADAVLMHDDPQKNEEYQEYALAHPIAPAPGKKAA